MATRLGISSFWAVLDQAAGSAGNFLLAAALAHHTSAREFGAFSVAFAVYLLGLGLTRALCGVPLLLDSTAHNRADLQEQARWIALAVGVALGGVCFTISRWLTPEVQHALGIVAVFLPPLLVFDYGRHCSMASGRFRQMAVADALWTGLQGVLFVLALRAKAMSLTTGLACWGAAGSAACVLLPCRFSLTGLRGALKWVATRSSTILDLIGEFLVTTCINQAIPLIIAAAAGLTLGGAFRAVQTLLGPANVVVMGLGSVALLEAKRVLARVPRRFSTFLVGWCGGVALSTFCAGIFFYLFPQFGALVLGPRWTDASALLPLVTLGTVLSGPIIAMQTGLRAQNRTRKAFQLRVLMTFPILVCISAGAVLATSTGVATGFAVAMALAAVIAILGSFRDFLNPPQGKPAHVAVSS